MNTSKLASFKNFKSLISNFKYLGACPEDLYSFSFLVSNDMLTCKKTYSDIPFAHRQHTHDGHCARIHGHNWSITLTFACHKTDKNGFVIDFGKLKYIKNWIDEYLDHACLLNEDDAEALEMLTDFGDLFKIYVLPNCSCEGIAQHLHTIFDQMVRSETDNRVWITVIEVTEDAKNSAVYTAE